MTTTDGITMQQYLTAVNAELNRWFGGDDPGKFYMLVAGDNNAQHAGPEVFGIGGTGVAISAALATVAAEIARLSGMDTERYLDYFGNVYRDAALEIAREREHGEGRLQ